MQICVGRVPYIVYTYRAQETEASTAGAFGLRGGWGLGGDGVISPGIVWLAKMPAQARAQAC